MLKKQCLIATSILIFTSNIFTGEYRFEINWKGLGSRVNYTRTISLPDREALGAVFRAPTSEEDMEYVEKVVIPRLSEEDGDKLRKHLSQSCAFNKKHYNKK